MLCGENHEVVAVEASGRGNQSVCAQMFKGSANLLGQKVVARPLVFGIDPQRSKVVDGQGHDL